ncbi:FMN-dependent NADH-azoreductase [Mycoplasma hafezii]|uniref:FMN-dependent NADH-azoreductase n=1 Tax=Mycoplasma hafezii TaxID=525886 RepID=UPI003CEC560B
MQKMLFLDGNVLPDDLSFSKHLMDRFYETAKNLNKYDLNRIDLNKTEHSRIFLTKETLNTYYNDINSDKWINLLKETDILVLSSSMINFGPSVVVKNFIDSISVANKTFSYKYSKKGDAIGLLTNLTVILVTSQGAPEGWYPHNNNEQWLIGTFKFLGAKVHHIGQYGTKVDPLKSEGPTKHIDELKDKFKELI